MNIQFLRGEHMPTSPLPFSPAVEAGGFIFVSGQASVDQSGRIINEDFEQECRRSFENVRIILRAAGLGFNDIVQVRNYVAKQEDLKRFNEIYKEYFSEPYPARTTLIGCLGNLLKFEVDVIAFRKS
jgi:2-iminobutanoate/2-iminopropanoate deaminase